MKVFRLTLLLILSLIVLPLCAAQDEPLTIAFRNERLPSVFKRLEKLTAYKFLFAYDDVAAYKVNGQIQKASFKQVMDYVLKDTPLTYDTDGQTVSVILKTALSQKQRTAKVIQGCVLSKEDGEPVMAEYC